MTLTKLPNKLLVDILYRCDGPSLDTALTVSKEFKSPVNEARKKIVGQLARRPGRVTAEAAPTRLELREMGFANPNMRGVLNAMRETTGADGAQASAPAPGPLMRNIEAHATLQEAQRAAGRYGGLANRNAGPMITDVGECNAQQQSHGFAIRRDAMFPGTGYEGTFENGIKQGLGLETHVNGGRYEGMFVNNERHGKGTLLFANGNIHEGVFEHGEIHGPGTISFTDGSRFEGNFDNGTPHGHGKVLYASGDLYEGDFENGPMQGKGTFTWANGDRYEGAFQNNCMHGHGTLIHVSGERFEGMFEHSLKHGPGTTTDADGNRHDVVYDRGQILDELSARLSQL